MKIFISYAHVDRYIVSELVKILRNAGLEPWFDHKLTVGRDWKKQLLEAIQECDAFLYTLSPESVISEWCQWEFGIAVKLSKPIIPVLIQEKTEIPESLAIYQYADFTQGPTTEGVAKLMGGLWSARVIVPKGKLEDIPENPSGLPAQAQEFKSSVSIYTSESENIITLNMLRNLIKKTSLLRHKIDFHMDYKVTTYDANFTHYFQIGNIILFGFVKSNNEDHGIISFSLTKKFNISNPQIIQLMMRGWLQQEIEIKNLEDIYSFDTYIYKEYKLVAEEKTHDNLLEDILTANYIMGVSLDSNNTQIIKTLSLFEIGEGIISISSEIYNDQIED